MLAHLLATLAKLLGPGGAKAIVADSLLMKQQLLIINRSRRRAPNLTVIDRLLPGFWTLFLSPHHIRRAAVILKPSTLLSFHDMLKRRKYRLLYSARRKGKPGPKGPSQELIEAILELNGTKLRRLFLCRAEFIRPVAVGGYPHCGYIRDDRWNGNVVGRMNSTLQWAK